MDNLEKQQYRERIFKINMEIPRILILANTIIMIYLSTIKMAGISFVIAAGCVISSIAISIFSLMAWRKDYRSTTEEKVTKKLMNPEIYEFVSVYLFGTGIIFALADKTWLPHLSVMWTGPLLFFLFSSLSSDKIQNILQIRTRYGK